MGSRSLPRPEPSPNRARWWPAPVILGLAAAVLVWVWVSEATQRQDRILESLGVAMVTLLLLLIWLALFSRLPWKRRLLVLGTILVVGTGLGLSLRVGGTTGDVLPILEWRWSRGDLLLPLPESRVGRGQPLRDDSAGPGFPGFFGPNRDGCVDDAALSRDWSNHPPRELWRIPVGEAWSGFAVSGPFAVTQEQRGALEWVTCYDVANGGLIWSHSDETRHEDPLGGPGPRATPSIQDGRVFSLGATGRLNALDLEDGTLAWSRDVLDDSGGSAPTYGVSASPLIVGETVVVMAGGRDASLIAYDRETGDVVWTGGNDPAGYSSPIRATIAGRDQIVVLNGAAVAGHSADDGTVLWRFPWPGQTENVSQPVLLPGDRVFVSTGYGIGGKLLQLRLDDNDAWAVELVWESRGLKAKFTNVVHRQGVLYGLDDGVLTALSVEAGTRFWKRGRYGHGQLIRSEDLLIVSAESGDVILVDASPDAFVERGRIEALSTRTWNSPALADGRLLVRNDREAVCFDVRYSDPP